ncbi:MAG: type II toxin-antitoxin system PemK/MazF family toxin [Candidatus Magasanikbacteria bacterium]
MLEGEKLQNFVDWTKLKIKLHLSEVKKFFNERDIWWASLGVNIGFEQDGKHQNFERPILVLKKFNNEVLLILPITSKYKKNKYYYGFEYNGKIFAVILSQVRLISSKRLLRKIRMLSEREFDEIKKLVKDII